MIVTSLSVGAADSTSTRIIVLFIVFLTIVVAVSVSPRRKLRFDSSSWSLNFPRITLFCVSKLLLQRLEGGYR